MRMRNVLYAKREFTREKIIGMLTDLQKLKRLMNFPLTKKEIDLFNFIRLHREYNWPVPIIVADLFEEMWRKYENH
jgi:hypothetical protein